MTISNDVDWLLEVKDRFDAKGIGGGDFYYLLQTMLTEGNISFPQLLADAADGNGCTVHEGLSYSLDQDWDDPSAFDEVDFFVGDVESSRLSVPDYICLIKLASAAYLALFAHDSDRIRNSVDQIVRRFGEGRG